jgi:hypothetical protein
MDNRLIKMAHGRLEDVCSKTFEPQARPGTSQNLSAVRCFRPEVLHESGVILHLQPYITLGMLKKYGYLRYLIRR